MSNLINAELLERAAEHIDYWAGEGIGAAIEADIDRNDLEGLAVHIRESAKLIFDNEYNPDEY